MNTKKKHPTMPRQTRHTRKRRANPGFDLAQLAWACEPENDDEREQQRRREPWFTFWPQIDESEAEGLLRQILALRRTSLRSQDAGGSETQEGLLLAAKLIEGALGWAIADRMNLSSTWAYLLKTPDLWRNDRNLHKLLAVDSLRLPVTLMLPQVRMTLAEALDRAFDGVDHPMLKAAKGGRRGIARRKRAQIQITMLEWIEWQVVAKYLSVTQAHDAVREACGLGSIQAIRNWKRSFKSSEGALETLDLAARIGRMEKEHQDPTGDAKLAPLAAKLRSLDLRATGADYKRVSQSRSETKVSRPERRAT